MDAGKRSVLYTRPLLKLRSVVECLNDDNQKPAIAAGTQASFEARYEDGLEGSSKGGRRAGEK